MNKITDIIVNKRYWIMGLFVGLAIGCLLLFSSITINYDTTKYLEEGSPTRVGLEVMGEEFGSDGSFQVMIDNVTREEANEIKNKLEQIENVESVLFNSDSENNYHDGYALLNVFLTVSNFDNVARDVISATKEELNGYSYHLNEGAINSVYISDTVNSDMYKILIVALIIVFIILIINSVSWIEPVIFMIVIGICIVINMGTNAFLPSISFVTGSICAVMQLALSMDYSIMLLHSFIEEKETNSNESDLINAKNALKKSVVPILSSSLTTVAGLLALALMKFKIGLDIGVVLAKGIIVSLITVIVFMPGLLIIFSKVIDKTKHRSIYQIVKSKFPTFENKIARYQVKSRFVAIIVLAVLIVIGFVFYTKTDYTFLMEASNDPNSQINIDSKAVEAQFGGQNTSVILVPLGDEEKEKELIEYLGEYEYKGSSPFTSIQGIQTIGVNDYLTSSELASKYGLSEDMVSGVYQDINVNISEDDKLKVSDVLNHLYTSDYITSYCKKLQNTFDSLYELSLYLDDQVNATDLANVVTSAIGFSYSESNAQALINLIGSTKTFREALEIICEERLFQNLYESYGNYVLLATELNTQITKDDVGKYLNISSSKVNSIFGSNETILLKTFVKELDSIDISIDDLSKYFNYSYVINTMDISYTKDEAMDSDLFNYSLLPKELFILPYLLKSELTNLELQRSIYNRLSDYIDDINSILAQVPNKINLLNESLTLSKISLEFEVPESILENIYIDLDKEEITGTELLKYVYDNQYVVLLGPSMVEKFGDLYELVDYANNMFISEHYSRIIVNVKYKKTDEESGDVARLLRNEIGKFYDEYYTISDSIAFADFEDAFSTDSITISLISFIFIFLIIFISYRSIIVALILPTIIQGAIWFTMAINVWSGTSVYFLCYLTIVCIQMGTTIDYGILYTSNYLSARKENDVEASIEMAFQGSVSTILTSGLILIVAAFVVGVISQVSIISSIGYLLSVGSLISVLFILFALPQVLVICDKLIHKTTLRRK